MAITLNHIIIWSKDQKEASRFLADLFGLPAPYRFAHFDVVSIGGISFDYANLRGPGPVQRQHIAFLVSDEEFDRIFARLKARNVPYWADPRREKPHEICPDDGGRGIYFPDPSDHNFEIITRPYGRDSGNRNPEASAARDAMGA
jgi:catechol 2,3-dioxygenase-like lactoylglutathione lyase family enzyme